MHEPTDLIPMGYIANAFGIQGWVKIKASTQYEDSLDDYEVISLKLSDNQWVTKKIEKSFVRDGIFHAKFEGVDDRNAAFALRGATVAVARNEFPPLDEDEYYWVDLIGLTVINLENEPLGSVKNLMETGASDILVVNDGEIERLIPFVERHVIKVDMVNRQVIVDWGLDY